MVNDLMGSVEETRNVYKVGLNTTRVLMALGDLVVGWLLLRQAAVALDKLDAATGTRQGVLRGQGRRGTLVRGERVPRAGLEALHRRGDRPVADGPRRGRLLGHLAV